MVQRILLPEGQSNALGFGTVGAGGAPGGLPIAAVKQFIRNNQVGTMTVTSSVPVDLDILNPTPNPTYWGPALQCAIDLHDAGEDVRVIQFAANGTSVLQWTPGHADQYDALLTTACLGGRPTAATPYSIHLLSVRGEEESTNASSTGATNYVSNYGTAFLTPLTSMWGVAPRLHCARVYTATAGGLWVPQVQAAQSTLVLNTGGWLINTDALTTTDGTHYDPASINQLGHWLAQTVLTEIRGGAARLFFGGRPL